MTRVSHYCIIIITLLIAFTPVLLGNYIRQDDMAWQLWNGIKPSERYDYYHVLVELFRPISWPLILFTDKLSYALQSAVWGRLLNVLCMIASACLLYRWQIFFNKNRLMAITFAITMFTLPAFETFAATANYLLMTTSLLATAIATMGMWWAQLKSGRFFWFFSSSLLYLASLMDYPESSMFAWVMLAIAYLAQTTEADAIQRKKYLQRLMLIATVLLSSCVVYFVLGKIIQHFIAVPHPYGSAMNMNFNFIKAFSFYLATLVWHSHFWFWQSASMNFWDNLKSSLPLICFVALFIFALANNSQYQKNHFFRSVMTFLVIAILLALSYAPILLSSEFNVNFRYSMTIMSLLLYIIFWSLSQISPRYLSSYVLNFIFLSLMISGILLSNIFLERNIVGPNDHDFVFLHQTIMKKVLPSIEQNKPITVAIRCYIGPARVFEYNADKFEYGMRIWQYSGQCISSVIHVLRTLGVETTRGRPNEEIFMPQSEIVKVPWGILMSVSNDLSDQQIMTEANSISPYPLVIINPTDAGNYHSFDLYKKYL